MTCDYPPLPSPPLHPLRNLQCPVLLLPLPQKMFIRIPSPSNSRPDLISLRAFLVSRSLAKVTFSPLNLTMDQEPHVFYHTRRPFTSNALLTGHGKWTNSGYAPLPPHPPHPWGDVEGLHQIKDVMSELRRTWGDQFTTEIRQISIKTLKEAKIRELKQRLRRWQRRKTKSLMIEEKQSLTKFKVLWRT